MIVIETLEKIFNILLPISLIIAFFTGIKEKVAKENIEITKFSQTKEESTWINKVDIFIKIISIIFLIGLIVILWIKCKITWIWLVFAFPVYIERIIEAYISIGIVRDVVTSPQKEKLSYREKNAIGTVAYIVWFWGIYNGFEKIVEVIREYPHIIISDFSMIMCYVFTLFLYIFFICALSPNLIFFCIDELKKINIFFSSKHRLQSYENYFIGWCGKSIRINSLMVMYIGKIINRKLLCKIIGILLAPIVLISDIIIFVTLAIFSIIRSTIGYLFLLMSLFLKTMIRIINWISQLSDKRIVALSFRIAFILALTIVVIMNRYQPFLKNYEESTAVLEFVASSIIIPMIFEWIYSIRQQEKNSI